MTLTRFESIDAIHVFAGDDYEVPVLEPEAIALLSRYEDRASHFETASFLVKDAPPLVDQSGHLVLDSEPFLLRCERSRSWDAAKSCGRAIAGARR